MRELHGRQQQQQQKQQQREAKAAAAAAAEPPRDHARRDELKARAGAFAAATCAPVASGALEDEARFIAAQVDGRFDRVVPTLCLDLFASPVERAPSCLTRTAALE